MAKLSLKFSGGDKIRKALIDAAGKAKPEVLRVGFLQDATYPDGTSVATVAFFNEFGTSRAPPRPFFRQMIASKSPGWGQALVKALRANGGDTHAALNLMGEGIKGQLVESIRNFSSPGNAPSTIAKKGFDKPLVDTGLMIRSVDYEVSDK